MTMRWGIGVLAWALLGATAASAEVPRDAREAVRRIAIQHNGRHKPFDSFARETLKQVTGSPRHGDEDPVETILSIIGFPDRWQARPLIAVPFVPLREALGMDRHAARISYNDLVATRKLMRMLPAIVAKQQRDEKLTMLEEETMDAFNRFAAFSRLLEQELALVPPPVSWAAGAVSAFADTGPLGPETGSRMVPTPSTASPTWVSIAQSAGSQEPQQTALREAWQALIAAIRRDDDAAVIAAARQLRERLRATNPAAYPAAWRLELEVFSNRVSPFGAARWAYALAVLGLLGGLAKTGWARAGTVALWAGFVLHAAGIVIRVILGGRPPVSNFYETTLWLPLVAVALALVFERIYRVRYFALAAAILAAIMLVLADALPLDSSISPVVAVLRSNLWLTIHVLTIVASYGALALAMILAHLYGVLYLSRRARRSALVSLDTVLYRAIQVGVVLLAGGIMLGAVWANASWGRYWGWDPKETWALITLLWFLAVLHGRFAGWISGVGVALATISGFFLLLMTYYGVSFYLVGLHSYAGGHARPLPPLLIGYVVAEVVFMVLVGAAAMGRRRLT